MRWWRGLAAERPGCVPTGDRGNETEVLFHSNLNANTTPPPVGGAEFDLLNDGFTWPQNANGGGNVSYTTAWWCWTTGMNWMRRGITDYFAAHPIPP